ncbi:MAG: ABC transporter ATP-binding protein, partial [Ureaplasma sp.]|nr:ABC transporter ATP-binding protein [Ureaplasma sp.]
LLDIKKLKDENCNATKIQSKLSLNYSELASILLDYYILNGEKVLLEIIQDEIDSNIDSTIGNSNSSLMANNSNKINTKKDSAIKRIIKNENMEFSQAPLINLQDINYAVNEKHILKDINFEIKPGSFHAFIGENGAGKSTTIKLLVGLNNKYTGKLLINDVDVRYKENIRDGIAFVPDQTPFPTNFTVKAYLYHLTLLMTNLTLGEVNTDIDHYLTKFGITEIKNRNANRCSAGQKQKLLLISALIQRPKVIILDEPFANLDPSSRYMFMEELKEYQLKNNATIFLSTHILDEIKEYADHVTFIRKGKVLLTKEIANNNEITRLYREHYLNRDMNDD